MNNVIEVWQFEYLAGEGTSAYILVDKATAHGKVDVSPAGLRSAYDSGLLGAIIDGCMSGVLSAAIRQSVLHALQEATHGPIPWFDLPWLHMAGYRDRLSPVCWK